MELRNLLEYRIISYNIIIFSIVFVDNRYIGYFHKLIFYKPIRSRTLRIYFEKNIKKKKERKRNFQVTLILEKMLQVKKHQKTILEDIKEDENGKN